ncbi:MAG: glycosyltransferase family A protein [Halobacteriota archaeon]|jgi:hypothetical protein
MNNLIVTSTAYKAGKYAKQCIDSVRNQEDVAYRHCYISFDRETMRYLEEIEPTIHEDQRLALYYSEKKTFVEELLPLWLSLDPEDIVVWLDGDDWLAINEALAVVKSHYEQGAWATYGQFLWSSRYLDFARPGDVGCAWQSGDNPRQEPWRATHLKTFKAGLIRHIRTSDLKWPDGEWAGVGGALDQRIMLAILEMAQERAHFISQVLYVFNCKGGAWEIKCPEEERRKGDHELRRVRNLPKYPRLQHY